MKMRDMNEERRPIRRPQAGRMTKKNERKKNEMENVACNGNSLIN